MANATAVSSFTAITPATELLPPWKHRPNARPSSSRGSGTRCCSQTEEPTNGYLPFDLSSLHDIPTVDVYSNRRANYNARRRLIQNRGVPNIYPEVYGQATKIEKLWKDWKSVLRDSHSRGLEYLTPEIDPEDMAIMENDGLWIEKKYPDVKSMPVIITREGEILK